MPNQNSGLAELAQMMQLVNGGGQDNSAALQQQGAMQWMQMQQQRQQQAAEMEFRQQQLALQGRHYGADAAYRDRALAQQGRYEEGNLAKQQAMFDQAARAQLEHQSLALAAIGQNAKAEEDRARRDDLKEQLAMTRYYADIGARRYDDEQKVLAADRQQLVHSNTSLLTQHIHNGGKFTDKVGLSFMEGIDPKQAGYMRLDAAQEVAKRQLADLQPLKTSYAIDPEPKTLALIHAKLSELEGLEPAVQQFLNLPKLKAEFGTPAARGAAGASNAQARAENPELAKQLDEQEELRRIAHDKRWARDEEIRKRERKFEIQRQAAPAWVQPVPSLF
jgi:hypothetical protein